MHNMASIICMFTKTSFLLFHCCFVMLHGDNGKLQALYFERT